MDAMILAAGLGTRLRPLTDHTPKALVDVGGVPMLERVARRLVAAGADRLVINVHHLAEQVERVVAERDGFGAEAYVSVEPERRLETGGGLRHAERFFRKDAPFFLHNADILTDLDLGTLYAAHRAADPLATLAVRAAETDRYLVFDEDGVLCGYAHGGEEHLVRTPERPQRLDFCGVQVLSPRIFDLMTETGVFSIIPVYLRLARAGERVLAHRVDGAAWIDIGDHERLARARERFGEG